MISFNYFRQRKLKNLPPLFIPTAKKSNKTDQDHVQSDFASIDTPQIIDHRGETVPTLKQETSDDKAVIPETEMNIQHLLIGDERLCLTNETCSGTALIFGTNVCKTENKYDNEHESFLNVLKSSWLNYEADISLQ